MGTTVSWRYELTECFVKNAGWQGQNVDEC